MNLVKGNEYFNDYINIKDHLLKNVDQKNLQRIIQEILRATKKKSTFFSCGNGGSAATAEHLSCDFSKGSCTNTDLNIKVFSLNSNISLIPKVSFVFQSSSLISPFMILTCKFPSPA